MTTLICNCNRTMPLDVPALGRALGETLTEHTTLCRREAPAFQQAARSGAAKGTLVESWMTSASHAANTGSEVVLWHPARPAE